MEKEFQELQEKYSALSRLHNSLVEATNDLEKKYKEALGEKQFLQAQLLNCQKALDINKEIMRQTLTQNNELKEKNSDEIILLREEMKRLKAELKDK